MTSTLLDNKLSTEMLTIVDTCLNVQSTDEFSTMVVPKVQELIGQEMFAYGVADLQAMRSVKMVNHRFPIGFLQTIIDSAGRCSSPMFKRWLVTQQLQQVELSSNNRQIARSEDNLYRDFEFRNLASHGLFDVGKRYTSYFGFAQIPEKIGPYHQYVINLLVPHLHVAFTRTLTPDEPKTSYQNALTLPSNHLNPRPAQSKPGPNGALSNRELEVLKWLREGKTNWEIGSILSISEYTVKNHVQRIIRKLDACNRQHVVAKALDSGLIHL